MAEAAAAAAPAAEATPAAKKTGLTIGLLVGGLVLGGAAGTFVVAPRLVPSAGAVADSAGEHGTEGEAKGDGEKGGPEAEAPKLVKLDNIIVNPAGSQGSRFLMASIVLAVETDKLEADLHARDAELRDKVTTVLEVMTMAQLTAPGARDTVKARVTSMIGELVGKQKFKVFLPQFVIQ